MKFDDIIALAKQGYKPADIKELMSIEVPEDKHAETQEAEETSADVSEEQTEPEPEDKTDYKTLYEESQKRLRAAQAANTKQDIQGKADQKSDLDIFSEYVQSFM